MNVTVEMPVGDRAAPPLEDLGGSCPVVSTQTLPPGWEETTWASAERGNEVVRPPQALVWSSVKWVTEGCADDVSRYSGNIVSAAGWSQKSPYCEFTFKNYIYKNKNKNRNKETFLQSAHVQGLSVFYQFI